MPDIRDITAQLASEDADISRLRSTCAVTADEKSLQVSYHVRLTMIDGEVADMLRHRKTCSVCGCIRWQMNSLQAVSARPALVRSYHLGLYDARLVTMVWPCPCHLSAGDQTVAGEDRSGREKGQGKEEICPKDIP